MSTLAILPLDTEDLPFARQMLFEAAFWRPDSERPPRDETLQRPDLAVYLEGWGRPGDHGLIAHVSDQPAGAVWVRHFDQHRHGYGYIDDRTPELTLAVAASFRRRGIARCLLIALIVQQRLAGTERLSLSVEDDNPARILYEQLGFTVHQAKGGARTMVRTLPDAEDGHSVVGGGEHPAPHEKPRP